MHDIPTLREGRKVDVLEKINCSAHETETCQMQFNFTFYTNCSFCSDESIRVGSDADGVSDNGIILKTSSWICWWGHVGMTGFLYGKVNRSEAIIKTNSKACGICSKVLGERLAGILQECSKCK